MKPRIREMPIQACGVRDECFCGGGVVVGGSGEGEDEGEEGWALRMPTTPGAVGVPGGASGWIESGSRVELSGRKGPGISRGSTSFRVESSVFVESGHRTSSGCGTEYLFA